LIHAEMPPAPCDLLTQFDETGGAASDRLLLRVRERGDMQVKVSCYVEAVLPASADPRIDLNGLQAFSLPGTPSVKCG
jgi:hypothetical protein